MPAALVATVLEEEAKRQAAQDAAREETILPDDLLPGVGAENMTLREGLRRGGWSIVTVLGLLEFVQFFDNAALAVLAPDIQSSLGVSDAVLGAIGGAFGLLFLLGSVPISSLADRMPRTKLAAVSMMVWSVIIFATGLVVNAAQLFVARMGAGLGQAYSLPVNQPVLIDNYPIEVRGKVFALLQSFSMASLAVGPVFAGTIAGLAGGDEGWRVVFFITALIALPIAISALFLHEPRRGRNEMQAVLGEELEEDEDELPISLSVAFSRLKKIRSFYFFLVGMAALGFALFTIPLFLNLFLEDEFGLSAFERGIFGSLTILPAFFAVAYAGRRTDQLFRDSPPRAMMFLGALVGGVRGVHRGRAVHAHGVPPGGLLRDRAGAVPGRLRHHPGRRRRRDPLPPPLPGYRPHRGVPLRVRLVLRGGAHRPALRRVRRAHGAHARRAPGHADRRQPHRLWLALHPR